MKLLIFGNGYLGNKFLGYFGADAVMSGQPRLDSLQQAVDEIRRHRADAVINCAGKTGRPNIDWCEDHKAETLHANVTVPLLLCRACAETGAKMVHLGTGGIYQGHGMREDDPPNFLESYYSKTKWMAETALKDFDVLQLRIMLPADGVPHPRNLITKLLSYPETINALNSITVLPDLLDATRQLLERKASGIFNAVNPHPVMTRVILEMHNRYAAQKKEIRDISLEAFRRRMKTPRPECTLAADKLRDAGIGMRPACEALDACVREYAARTEVSLSSIPV